MIKQEENYRREFTDALCDYVDMGNTKYAIYTDRIYQSIFREKANEYRQISNLLKKEKVRDTLYAEVLDLIASYVLLYMSISLFCRKIITSCK